MKKIINTLALLSFLLSFSQSTYQGNITLINQQQVDDFGNMEYEEVTGYVRIEPNNPSDIDNLSALSTIEVIGGSLDIISTEIDWLDGLVNLREVGGLLQIYNNDLLIDLQDLGNLETVFNLSIVDNDLLENVNGLDSLTAIYNNIEIINNPSLQSLADLSNLGIVSGTLFIQSNPQLESLVGLGNLTSIGGNLTVSSCQSLTNLQGLNNISEILGTLYIAGNSNLDDFCALYNLIDSNGIAGNYIVTGNQENPSISDISNDCSNDYSFDFLYPLGGEFFSSPTIRVKLNSSVELENNTEANVYYKTNTTSWTFDDSYQLEEDGLVYSFNWIKPSFSEPKAIKLRVEILINGELVSSESSSFFVQPINHFSSDGFYNEGVSEIDFPLQGFIEPNQWSENFTSTAHNCLNGNARDYVYLPISDSCQKDLRASFSGVVINIKSDYENSLCGPNTDMKYGKNIVIQSLEDRTFAIRYAHLYSIRPDIQVGDVISKNQLLGKVGGTGTLIPHLHTSLYKNIYDYIELDFSDSQNGIITKNIFELLQTDFTANANETPNCNILQTMHSAEFNYEINFTTIILNLPIENMVNFESFIEMSYNNIFGNLVLGSFVENLAVPQNQSSEAIQSINGLENLYSIDGNLVISQTNISNLNGLRNLTYVSGDVIIKNNVSLSDFCGLYSLIENQGIGGDFIVNGNQINPTQDNILLDFNCDTTLGIVSEQNIDLVNIYPNPVYDLLHIDAKSQVVIEFIEVYDSQGKKILFQNKNFDSIDVSNFSKGLYFFCIKTKDYFHAKKIIKK